MGIPAAPAFLEVSLHHPCSEKAFAGSIPLSACTTLTWHPCPSTVFLALPCPSSALHGSRCFVSAGEGEREGGNWYCASGSGLPTQKGCLKQETSLSPSIGHPGLGLGGATTIWLLCHSHNMASTSWSEMAAIPGLSSSRGRRKGQEGEQLIPLRCFLKSTRGNWCLASHVTTPGCQELWSYVTIWFPPKKQSSITERGRGGMSCGGCGAR